MTITAIIVSCRKCGEELHDPASKARKVGSTCWRRLTRAQKLEMLALAAAEDKPGYIPPTRPASLEARRNHADVERVTAPAPSAKRCVHEDNPATCALCRRDDDPKRITDRVIGLVQRLPMDQRIAAQREAAIRRYQPTPTHQLTIGDPT